VTSRRRRVVLGAMGVLVVALGIWAGGKAWRLWRHADSLRQVLPRLEERANPDMLRDLQPADIAALTDDFSTLASDLIAIEHEVGPFLPIAGLLGWVPKYGGDIAAGPALVEVVGGIARVGQLALDGLQPVLVAWKEPPTDAQGNLLERLIPPLAEAKPQLVTAQAELDEVIAARASIDSSSLSPVAAKQVDRLDRYLPMLQLAVRGAQLAPNLLGAQGPRSYLVIAQNNQELRASGGFISGVGLLHLNEGRIEDLSFQDSYAVDDFSKPHPPAPAPLKKYMKADILVLRDANWSADFATAAQVMAGLYALDQEVAVDGVIAADLTAVQWLVEALQPLQLQGYDQPVTGANVLDFMKAAWATPLEAPSIEVWEGGSQEERLAWLSHRKDFMGLLLQAMRDKVEGGKDVDLGRLLTALKRTLDEKHVLVHVDDPEASELLQAAGWSGAILPGGQDFLMVVDSNLGFNKVNPNVREVISYRVILDEGERPSAELTLLYRHTADIRLEECIHEPSYGASYDDMMNRCYWDYVRVYVPGGSELKEAVGFDPGSTESLSGEQGTQVFTGFFVLAPGEERVMTLRYDLPLTVVADGVYRLRVQKQPGTGSLPLHMQVSGAAEVSFERSLSTDQEIEVLLGE